MPFWPKTWFWPKMTLFDTFLKNDSFAKPWFWHFHKIQKTVIFTCAQFASIHVSKHPWRCKLNKKCVILYLRTTYNNRGAKTEKELQYVNFIIFDQKMTFLTFLRSPQRFQGWTKNDPKMTKTTNFKGAFYRTFLDHFLTLFRLFSTFYHFYLIILIKFLKFSLRLAPSVFLTT